jgi:hypothetical protein
MLFRICGTAILIVLSFSGFVFCDDGPNHQIKQAPPIRLGTSGGNSHDETTQFCCAGTLGAEVKDRRGARYILSNNHVLAKSNHATLGDPIIQPGLIDVNCFANRAQVVAHLSEFAQIRFSGTNDVDAALAEIVPGMVSRRGRIIDIGRPGQPIEPVIGMRVKKSGRTTGKTFGRIVAINVSVNVELPRHCGDDHGDNARFIDQFIVNSTTTRQFIDSGDSGSLVVKRRKTCPPAVGLLFAGDDQGNATVNRISNVLSTFQVSVVGCSATATATATEASSLDMNRLNSAVIQAEEIRQRHEDELFRIPGVVGVGIGETIEGAANAGIVVFVQKKSQTAASSTAIPRTLDQVPVRVILTSGFKAI